MAYAKEISVDVAIAAFLQNWMEFSRENNNMKITLKPFLGGKHRFTLLPIDFGESFVKHCNVLQLATGRWCAANVTLRISRRPGPG